MAQNSARQISTPALSLGPDGEGGAAVSGAGAAWPQLPQKAPPEASGAPQEAQTPVDEGGGEASTGIPQLPQKAVPGGRLAPQL